jgi:hypothetical protein
MNNWLSPQKARNSGSCEQKQVIQWPKLLLDDDDDDDDELGKTLDMYLSGQGHTVEL